MPDPPTDWQHLAFTGPAALAALRARRTHGPAGVAGAAVGVGHARPVLRPSASRSQRCGNKRFERLGVPEIC